MTDSSRKKAGYEYLLAYKITVPIYDYAVEFCNVYIDPYSRTRDQMVQSARSGMQNIAEGGFNERLYRKRTEYRNKNNS